jgi:hypothetical protein
LVAASTGLAYGKAESARPSVRVTQFSPLVVTGQRFKPVERIVIRVTTSDKGIVRRTRVSPRGTFVARFEAVMGDRCGDAFSVVVTTASGRMAKATVPQPLCPPAMP